MKFLFFIWNEIKYKFPTGQELNNENIYRFFKIFLKVLLQNKFIFSICTDLRILYCIKIQCEVKICRFTGLYLQLELYFYKLKPHSGKFFSIKLNRHGGSATTPFHLLLRHMIRYAYWICWNDFFASLDKELECWTIPFLELLFFVYEEILKV